ncbi:hypothetical protein E1264_18390 [Actinomadura sp. KC216]|uniref:hypothetical protein n=1 Tax=Actinomadura sp. KC216 TaxID=2530370 RepID=UPI00104573DD|nr:hypothetical protein [Actinomadura sp. KC216]TDB86265.1 hypothetical protein E1264_18390 [Actinomadura sp. KC216]
MTPEEEREHARDLGEMLAVFTATLDAVVPESQYYRGERENPDQLAAYGNMMQRAATRRRERERRAAE